MTGPARRPVSFGQRVGCHLREMWDGLWFVLVPVLLVLGVAAACLAMVGGIVFVARVAWTLAGQL